MRAWLRLSVRILLVAFFSVAAVGAAEGPETNRDASHDRQFPTWRLSDWEKERENGLETFLSPTAELTREQLKKRITYNDGKLVVPEDFTVPSVYKALEAYRQRMERSEDGNDTVELRRKVLFLANRANSIYGAPYERHKVVAKRKEIAQAKFGLRCSTEACMKVYKTNNVYSLFDPSIGLPELQVEAEKVRKLENELSDVELSNPRFLQWESDLLKRSAEILVDIREIDKAKKADSSSDK